MILEFVSPSTSISRGRWPPFLAAHRGREAGELIGARRPLLARLCRLGIEIPMIMISSLMSNRVMITSLIEYPGRQICLLFVVVRAQ